MLAEGQDKVSYNSGEEMRMKIMVANRHHADFHAVI